MKPIYYFFLFFIFQSAFSDQNFHFPKECQPFINPAVEEQNKDVKNIIGDVDFTSDNIPKLKKTSSKATQVCESNHCLVGIKVNDTSAKIPRDTYYEYDFSKANKDNFERFNLPTESQSKFYTLQVKSYGLTKESPNSKVIRARQYYFFEVNDGNCQLFRIYQESGISSSTTKKELMISSDVCQKLTTSSTNNDAKQSIYTSFFGDCQIANLADIDSGIGNLKAGKSHQSCSSLNIQHTYQEGLSPDEANQLVDLSCNSLNSINLSKNTSDPISGKVQQKKHTTK